MAEGYAHATGRPGAAMHLGSGATNMQALADAFLDSVPMSDLPGGRPPPG